MTINTGKFELVLSQKLGMINSGTSNLDLLAHAQVIQQLQSGTVSVVSTFGSLPDAALNLGRLYFVQDVEELYWSNVEYGWLPITTLSLNTLWTWGGNLCGVIGDGGITSRSSPGTTSGCGITWCEASAGRYISAAIKTDGTLWTWGRNNYGQLGDLSVVNRSSPGTAVGGGNNWCQISAHTYSMASIKTDGTAWTWGLNNNGQLGTLTTVNRSSPGTIIGGGTTWCQISVGRCHTGAVKTDGTLWTWGYNGLGELGDSSVVSRSSPSTTAGGGTTWCQIHAGDNHTAALKSDGTAWTWGLNAQGRLGDGTVVARSSPVTTAGGGNTWCQIHAGYGHTAAVKTDGTAWTWGRGGEGRLGSGTELYRSSPGTLLGGGTTWCQINAGVTSATSAAIKTDGTAWTWGYNGRGNLGDGTVINKSSPVTTLGGGSTWCQISVGRQQTAAIQSKTF